MLVLSRKLDEVICIGDDIEIVLGELAMLFHLPAHLSCRRIDAIERIGGTDDQVTAGGQFLPEDFLFKRYFPEFFPVGGFDVGSHSDISFLRPGGRVPGSRHTALRSTVTLSA